MKATHETIALLDPKWEVSIKSLPSELRETLGRESRRSIEARRYGVYQENKAL